MELLAILGRGIQRLSENADPTKVKSWTLTDALEVCAEDSSHLTVQVPSNDDHPHSMMGGGHLTMHAAAILIKSQKPKEVVCAFGHRAGYLQDINGPTESEVMSWMLPAYLEAEGITMMPNVTVWPRTRTYPGPSNTGSEVRCVLNHALELNVRSVGFVGTSIHMPRVGAHLTKCFTRHEQYRGISVQLYEAEELLLQEDPMQYGGIVETMRASKSFERMFPREAQGIKNIVLDVYGDAKPKIV